MIDSSRVYHWFSISNGRAGPSRGWNVDIDGWDGIIAKCKENYELYGLTTSLLRGPEGDDGAYPLDFYVPTSVSKHYSAGSIRDFCGRIKDAGLEVVPYFGSLTHDSKMAAAVADPGAWDWMASETVRPWIDGGCRALSFDHVGAYAIKPCPAWGYLRYLQSFGGLTIYGEPHGGGVDDLTVAGDELEGCVVENVHWIKAWKKHEFRERFEGDVIRIMSWGSREELEQILADGHRVAVKNGDLGVLEDWRGVA